MECIAKTLVQDITEENAELLLGAKANRGLLLPGQLPRLPRSRSSLPSIPYYDSQLSRSNSNPSRADMAGYGDALALQPVPEADDAAAAEEGEHVSSSHACADYQL